ncbi:condensin complex protein MksE [Pedobacter immunditicola]|uniref:condensin complex protein MksE n=1 Tax=Pedobacter immunditicola TaxID=3133440 RepID=UPI0030A0B606
MNEALKFLMHEDAPRLFSKVDYALKNGIHIQDYRTQTEIFGFINENFQSMRLYYEEYFDIVLDHGGETVEKYFFIDFIAKSRGGIPEDNRHFLPNEYVIIGFLLFKVIFIDGYIELNTVSRFQRMLRLDYEELKPGIYRTLAKARRDKNTHMDDERVDKIIAGAMDEFRKIGWIVFEGELFDVMPSFQRLPKIYGDYINNIESWLNEEKDEKLS